MGFFSNLLGFGKAPKEKTQAEMTKEALEEEAAGGVVKFSDLFVAEDVVEEEDEIDG